MLVVRVVVGMDILDTGVVASAFGGEAETAAG